MRSLRIAFVLLTTFVFFIFLNNASGRLFPPTKATTTDTASTQSQCEQKYQAYTQSTTQFQSDGSSSSADSTNQAYADYKSCLDASEKSIASATKTNQEAAIKDQARNVYVAFGAMILVLVLTVLIRNRLPLLAASMLLGGLFFVLYFPASNVVSSWYSAISSTSEAVGRSLDNAILTTSTIGFIALVLASVFGIEKRPRL